MTTSSHTTRPTRRAAASEQEATVLKLSDSSDIISVMPYLLGYQPSNRLVFMVIDGKRLGLTAAMPLQALDDPEEARHSMMAAVERFETPMVALACWAEDREVAEEALACAEIWLGPDRVLDSVAVLPQRWFSRLGEGAGSSGDTSQLGSTPAVAQAVMAGLVSRESRDVAVAVVDGPGADDLDACERLLLDAEDSLVGRAWNHWDMQAHRKHIELLTRVRDDEAEIAGQELALLAVLADEPQVRELMWLHLGRRNAVHAEALWTRVVAQTPAPWARGALLMLGFSSWLSGNGAVLVACIERLLDLSPHDESAALLDALNREAVPPSAWEARRADEVFGRGA